MDTKSRDDEIQSLTNLLNILRASLRPFQLKLDEWSKLSDKEKKETSALSTSEYRQLHRIQIDIQQCVIHLDTLKRTVSMRMSEEETEALCPQYIKKKRGLLSRAEQQSIAEQEAKALATQHTP